MCPALASSDCLYHHTRVTITWLLVRYHLDTNPPVTVMWQICPGGNLLIWLITALCAPTVSLSSARTRGEWEGRKLRFWELQYLSKRVVHFELLFVKYTIRSIVCEASCYSVTWSLCHLVTWPLGHMVTWSLGHLVTWSLGHLVT